MFQPVLAKHSKSFNLIDALSVGVDRIHRNLEPMRRQVENWRQTQITALAGASVDGVVAMIAIRLGARAGLS